MARNILTDEQISDFMDENYAYKPRLEDFMLDIMGAAPMLLGFPMEISRPAAHKKLAKDFLRLGRKNLKKVRRLREDMLELVTEDPSSTAAKDIAKVLDRVKWINRGGRMPRAYQPDEIEGFKEYMIGLKHAPQELLDPLKDIMLTAHGEYGGVVEPSKESLEVSTSARDRFESLAHELTHVEDLKGHFGVPWEDFGDSAVMHYLMTGEKDRFESPPSEEWLTKLRDMDEKLSRKGFYEGKAYDTGVKLGPRLREGYIPHEDWLKQMDESAGIIEERFGINPTEEQIMEEYIPGYESDQGLLNLLEGLKDLLEQMGDE